VFPPFRKLDFQMLGNRRWSWKPRRTCLSTRESCNCDWLSDVHIDISVQTKLLASEQR